MITMLDLLFGTKSERIAKRIYKQFDQGHKFAIIVPGTKFLTSKVTMQDAEQVRNCFSVPIYLMTSINLDTRTDYVDLIVASHNLAIAWDSYVKITKSIIMESFGPVHWNHFLLNSIYPLQDNIMKNLDVRLPLPPFERIEEDESL